MDTRRAWGCSEGGSLVASAKSSKESQNTYLSKWNKSCCAFLSRKSNQHLSAECETCGGERTRIAVGWAGSDGVGLGLELAATR